MDNKVLIVLGYSRSGTSFIASWLHNCGLNMGNNLIEATWMNEKGFYEDNDILSFQNSIYQRERKKNPKVSLTLNLEDNEKAIDIIQKRNEQFSQWGWKDPNTNLLMQNLWHGLIPNAKIVLVYRSYHNVVDSLQRVKRNIHRPNKIAAVINLIKDKLKIQNAKKNNDCLREWIKHNEYALDYIKKNKAEEDYIVITVNSLLIKHEKIFQVITKKMGLNLEYVDPNRLYDDELFQNSEKNKYVFDKQLLLKADALLKELESLSI